MKTVHFKPELDITGRVQELRKVCVTEITKEYQRTLTDSEIDRDRFDYVAQAQTLENTKANAKASADSFKAEISAIETLMKEKLTRIDTGKRKVNNALYGVPNYKIGLMEFYDQYGEMIESRKLTPDEATGQMFNNAGEATEEAAAAPENSIKEIGFSGDSENVQDAEFEEVRDSDQDKPKDQPKKKTRQSSKSKKAAETKVSEENETDPADEPKEKDETEMEAPFVDEDEEEQPWDAEDLKD